MDIGRNTWSIFRGQSMSMTKCQRSIQDSDLVYIVIMSFSVLVLDLIAIETSESESHISFLRIIQGVFLILPNLKL